LRNGTKRVDGGFDRRDGKDGEDEGVGQCAGEKEWRERERDDDECGTGKRGGMSGDGEESKG